MSVFVIAEAGVNHNGDVGRALDLVDCAAAAGADAVKFQTFKAGRVVVAGARKAEYQARHTGANQSQFDMLHALELDHAAHAALVERSRARGIEFMSTPFDPESLVMLVRDFRIARIKLPSGDMTYGPLLLAAARTGIPVVLSTGMSDLDDIHAALRVLAFGMTHAEGDPTDEALANAYESDAGREVLAARVTLLQCTSEYPAPVEDINLRAMETMRREFGLAIGFSDHSAGIGAAIAAAALGAVLIEKHFTLDRALPGPDHAASLEPDELTSMVAGIRVAAAALGRPDKRPAASEHANRSVARRSLVAARRIERGEPFEPDNLAAKRPGTGLSPMLYWWMLGRTATRDYQPDEPIRQ